MDSNDSRTPSPIEGWLAKEGHVFRNWKNRWFRVAAGELTYQHDVDSTDILGRVPLAGMLVSRSKNRLLLTMSASAQSTDALGAKAAKRPVHSAYAFACKTDQAAAEWEAALRSHSTFATAAANADAAPTPSNAAKSRVDETVDAVNRAEQVALEVVNRADGGRLITSPDRDLVKAEAAALVIEAVKSARKRASSADPKAAAAAVDAMGAPRGAAGDAETLDMPRATQEEASTSAAKAADAASPAGGAQSISPASVLATCPSPRPPSPNQHCAFGTAADAPDAPPPATGTAGGPSAEAPSAAAVSPSPTRVAPAASAMDASPAPSPGPSPGPSLGWLTSAPSTPLEAMTPEMAMTPEAGATPASGMGVAEAADRLPLEGDASTAGSEGGVLLESSQRESVSQRRRQSSGAVTSARSSRSLAASLSLGVDRAEEALPEWLQDAQAALDGSSRPAPPEEQEVPDWLLGAEEALATSREVAPPPRPSAAPTAPSAPPPAPPPPPDGDAKAAELAAELERIRAEHAALLAEQQERVRRASEAEARAERAARVLDAELMRLRAAEADAAESVPLAHNGPLSPVLSKTGPKGSVKFKSKAVEDESGKMDLVSVSRGEGQPLVERLLQVVGNAISLLDVESGEAADVWAMDQVAEVAQQQEALLLEFTARDEASEQQPGKKRLSLVRRLSRASNHASEPAAKRDGGRSKLTMIFMSEERASELHGLLRDRLLMIRSTPQ